MTDETIQSYAGFTLGPILDVLGHARKTREIWFGSYFFSWYMESLISRLVSPEIHFLTPHIDGAKNGGGKVELRANHSLTGKYHDRFVAKSSLLDADALFERIQIANADTLEGFVEFIDDLRLREEKQGGRAIGGGRDAIREILSGYLQARFFSMEDSEFQRVMADDGNGNEVRAADLLLNTLEASFNFTPGQSHQTCLRCKTLPGIVKAMDRVWDEGAEAPRKVPITLCPICLAKFRCHLGKALLDKVFPKGNGGSPVDADPLKERRFIEQAEHERRLAYPSIQEIASLELFEKHGEVLRGKLTAKRQKDRDAELSFEEIRNAVPDKTLKPYHKYFAIVQADGDNLGKLAAGIGNPTRLSAMLFKFAEAAEKLIWERGGLPIYIGGDDILAFMPVFYNGETVIDFVDAAARLYRDVVEGEVKNEKGLDISPTISFGINIAYYKYPLSTALKDAAGLLFGNAKSQKDAAAIQLTKHSGSRIGFNLKIHEDEFKKVCELLRWTLAEKRPRVPSDDDPPDAPKTIDFKLPGGLRYNLGRFEELLAFLPSPERLSAFFVNNFNEGEHLKFGGGLDEVQSLFAHYLFEKGDTNPVPPEAPDKREKWEEERRNIVKTAFSILKLTRFLTGEEAE